MVAATRAIGDCMNVTNLLLPDLEDALRENPSSVREALDELHAADIAELLRQLPSERQAHVLRLLPDDTTADAIDYLDGEHRVAVFTLLATELQVRVAAKMAADDRADMFAALEPGIRESVLARLPKEDATDVRTLMSWPPNTAGSLMTTDIAEIPSDLTIAEVLSSVRRVAAVAETISYVYLTERSTKRLVGVLSLRDLVLSPDDARASGVMNPDVVSVTAMTDQEDVAKTIAKYDFQALPVVDEQQRLLGIVTVDDLVDVVVREGTEDIHKLGGLETLDAPYLEIGLLRMMRKRAGWLSALFVGELLTATAMSHFEAEIAKAVVLALFVPLIISSGGNSGSQATTLVIRAMALGEVVLTDWWRVVRREVFAGLGLGLILGALGLIRVSLWHVMFDAYGEHWFAIGVTVAISLVGVVLWGTLAGSMLPFLLRRLGFDPASASAPFVATLVDVSGLVIYFTVASVILQGALL